MELKNETNERVIHQKIGEKSMADFIADTLLQIESNELDLEKADAIIKGCKQLNVHHKNIIDAQRVEIKQLEIKNGNTANY